MQRKGRNKRGVKCILCKRCRWLDGVYGWFCMEEICSKIGETRLIDTHIRGIMVFWE